MKNVILSCLFIAASASLYSQNIGGIEDELIAENVPNETDLTLTTTTLLVDSVAMIPYFNEYASDWNNSKVHPYNVDLTKMTDSIPLVLSHRDCDYVHSVCGEINSEFGYRRNRFHYGIDVDLNVADDVLSSFEGIVRIAKYDKTYGNVIVVRHQNGLETLYAHLSKFEVQVGDYVQAGDLIALGGNTGRSTGPHLHFEVRYLGEPIDPNDIIDYEDGRLKMNEIALSDKNFSYLKEIRKHLEFVCMAAIKKKFTV